MINQSMKLAIAAGLGLTSVGISISSPTLTDLGPDDLARFANGERVEVVAYRPNRVLAGAAGAAGVGVFGWWLWKELMEGDGTAPIQTVTPEGMTMPGQFIKAPEGVQPPEKYLDVSAVLANQLRPTLITGNPRIGKGIVVAHGIRQVKRRLDCPVWLIQPKYHPKEHAYWEPCDRVKGFMLEDYIGDADRMEELGNELTQFIQEWRKQSARPTLLVIDELSLLKAILPKWYEKGLIPQLKTEMSSGETDSRALWVVTQSPLATDIGITKGDRSTFDLLAIENSDSKEHLASLCASYDGVPKVENDLVYRQSLSPKKAIFYHSTCGEWLPMLAYRVPEGVEVAEVNGSNSGSSGSDLPARDSADLLPTTSVTSELPGNIHPSLFIAVAHALGKGCSDTAIIEEVMNYKGRKFEEGKELLNKIKAILEEHI